jgi:hypothetical protein
LFVCKVRTQLVAWLSALYNCSEEDETRAQRSEFIRAYNYNSKPTKLNYNSKPLQKAIDDARLRARSPPVNDGWTSSPRSDLP